MAIFGRRNSDSGGISQVEFQDSNQKRWPLLLAWLAAALLIAVALFYIGRWAYRSIFGNDAPQPVPVRPADSNLTPQPGAAPQPGTTPRPAPTPATPPSAQIPDSGPGEVLALFFGSSFAAAGLYYIVALRKSAKETGQA